MNVNKDPGTRRVVVLTYESLQSNTATARIIDEFGSDVVAIVALHQPPSLREHFESLRKSPVFFIWKATEVILYRFSTLLGPRFARVPNLPNLAKRAGAEYIQIFDVKDEDTAIAIEQLDADVLVSIHFPKLIGKRIREAARLRAINTHGSYLPDNRGLFPYFWTIARRDGHGGVTVHELAAGFDTGAILIQERLEPLHGETVFEYSLRSADLAGRLLVKAISAILDDVVEPRPQSVDSGSYVSWPRAADIRELRRNRGRLGSPLRVFQWARKSSES